MSEQTLDLPEATSPAKTATYTVQVEREFEVVWGADEARRIRR
jgi:hypothetical protein